MLHISFCLFSIRVLVRVASFVDSDVPASLSSLYKCTDVLARQVQERALAAMFGKSFLENYISHHFEDWPHSEPFSYIQFCCPVLVVAFRDSLLSSLQCCSTRSSLVFLLFMIPD